MNNKKGFTLVELLAVIVILAIILVLAVPKVLNTINKSKISSMESSAKMVASAVETNYQTSLALGSPISDTGSCMTIGNLDTNEYASCTYALENGKATVSLTGKTGGKFDGLSVFGTKNDVTCETVYVITLDANGGSLSMPLVPVVVEEAYGTLPTPSYVSKVFDGWYTELNGGTKVESTDVPTNNTTLYAHWFDSQFAADSWEAIKTNVHNGTTSLYHVGDTKDIYLGSSLGNHTVRIANMSTPSVCSNEGFSQTACGFVVEFVDVIPQFNMNSGSNKDGWKESEMRDYTSGTLLTAIESIIGTNIITNTTVVSGHGSTPGETNITTTDKVYVLAAHEVYEDVDNNENSGPDYYDTAYTSTRQLDYYANLGVTTSSYSGAVKKNNNSSASWWLRGAVSGGTDYYQYIYSNGAWDNGFPPFMVGISAAFRIA